MATPRSPLDELLHQHLAAAGGWLGFAPFMQQALYAPGLGYYANDSVKLGAMPADGSDFVTAPELSPLFSQTLALQIGQALTASGTDAVWEFGAGSGALAEQILTTLGSQVQCYTIVDISGQLRARQQQRLAAFGAQVQWADQLPASMQGVIVGNEVLDAMPVQLLHRVGGVWHERGVAAGPDGGFAWQDRPTDLRPPLEIDGAHDYLTEIHPQAEAFMRTLAERLQRGAAFFIDYGFPEDEYYHPQRHMGTVMCHRAHRSDDNPLADVGHKDITAHVNLTAMALAAQDAGLHVQGYTSQAQFLMNLGILPKMEQLPHAQRALAMKLILEHEMGELFKVLAVGCDPDWQAQGFARGDRMHRL